MANQTKVNPPVVEQLQWRYATKKFDPNKKIEKSLFQELEQALVLTPSSYGLQPWKFIVVSDQSKKEELANHSYNQPQPKDCSHLVVISRLSKIDEGYVHRFIELTSKTRNVEPESLDTYKGMMTGFVNRSSDEDLNHWMEKQCYIALGNLMTAAALLSVDSCPMEGFVKEKYDEILGLTEKGLSSVVVAALGYRADDDKYAKAKKVRHAVSDAVLHI